MLSFFDAYLNDLIQSFLDPRKRMFLGYLICAFIIALGYCLLVRKSSIKQSLSNILSKKVWLSASAKADYQITLINQLFMKLLSPVLVTQLALATILFHWFYELFPARPIWLSDWSELSIGLIFTTSYFVLDDFARFYVHRLLHQWPVLWSFHKVHHSATRLTPFTVFRTHPVESILFSLRSVLTQGICIATFVFFLGERADLVTVLGANILVFFFNVLGANLRHSHVHIRYWKPLEKLFISPAQHQIHHSIEKRHWDKNFGVALSIWDRLFGSFYHSESKPPRAFGIQNHQGHSFQSIYLAPFNESGSILKNGLKNAYRKLQNTINLVHRNTIYESSNDPH